MIGQPAKLAQLRLGTNSTPLLQMTNNSAAIVTDIFFAHTHASSQVVKLHDVPQGEASSDSNIVIEEHGSVSTSHQVRIVVDTTNELWAECDADDRVTVTLYGVVFARGT